MPVDSRGGAQAGHDIAVLWTAADRRCVLSWEDQHFRIRLMRGNEALQEQTGTDERPLLELARQWQRSATDDAKG